jgi:hypothetical protein
MMAADRHGVLGMLRSGVCRMRKSLVLAGLVQIAIASIANAAGPYGNIHVGNWKGGAFTDDNGGAFTHCGATSS